MVASDVSKRREVIVGVWLLEILKEIRTRCECSCGSIVWLLEYKEVETGAFLK